MKATFTELHDVSLITPRAYTDTRGQGRTVAPSGSIRIHTIDYLRGLFALSILVYHYATWGGYARFGTSVLHKLGIYAVCAFYVISGISFGYIYRRLRPNWAGVWSFAIKRFFRLWPLYAIATLGAILLALPARPKLSWILANLTLTFGLIKPTAYFAAGGWSIGNEVAFYCLFPAAIILLRKSQWAFLPFFATSLGVAWWYAFVRLDPTHTLASQWAVYIRPENHLFLFLAGVLVSSWIGKISLLPWVSYLALILAALIFVLLPLGEDEISIVTLWPRFAYGAICIAVCAIGALGRWPLPENADRALEWLGLTSYSIYLLHPIVYLSLERVVRQPVITALIALPVSLLTAHWVYRKIEAPIIRVGKSVAARGSAAASDDTTTITKVLA